MAKRAAAHTARHAPAWICGAGARDSHKCCRWMAASVARPSARTTACATGHHQNAWSRQTSGGSGPSG
eukprot:53780-Chlamydomonas_euryale.AAC.1